MFSNYLKIAYRNFLRYKSYSFINISGLTVGMTCCFLILIYVQHELQYDKFHEHSERIHRVVMSRTDLDKSFATISMPIGPALVSDFPEVEAATRLFPRHAVIEVAVPGAQAEANQLREKDFYFVDSTIFDVFTFKFLRGDARTALLQPNSVVITDRTAEKYFGSKWAQDASITGKTFLMEGKHPLKVTGVVKSFPGNSHLRFSFLASYETMFAIEGEEISNFLRSNWLYNPVFTYVKLKKGQSKAGLEKKMPQFLSKYTDPAFHTVTQLALQPLHDVHFYSEKLVSEDEVKGNITFVYTFVGVALITLLIASINYINLSIARSLRRSKEVGVRKALGALKGQLIKQFMGESLLFCGIALLLSLLLIVLLLPVLNNLTEKELAFSAIVSPGLLASYAVVFVLISVLSGAYPAFFVSAFDPITILKGKVSSSMTKGLFLRKALVMFQFCISFVLIVGALTVYRQLQLLKNSQLGFESSRVITAPLFSENRNSALGAGADSVLQERLTTFKNVLLDNRAIKGVTLSSKVPGTGYKVPYTLVVPEGKTREDNIFMSNVSVDYDFIQAYDLKMVAGRPFSKNFGTDIQEGCIINQKAVEQSGWSTPAQALGKVFQVGPKKCKVVGVVKDFHFKSLHNLVEPLVLVVTPKAFSWVSVHMQPASPAETAGFVSKKWQALFPGTIFEYSYLDEDLYRLYRPEQQLGQIVSYFAFIAIFISGLGLFGLTSFTIEQRLKEIGVRKVFGASVFNIIVLLLKEFTVIIIIASLVAIPLSYFLLSNWLNNFVYHVQLAVSSFLIAGILALVTAWITIGFKSAKAASNNPIKVLRSE